MAKGNTLGETARDVKFLFEMGTLRHVARTWNQFGGLPLANDAEHTFRTAMIAWFLAKQEGADVGHVMKMALVHDMSETRVGDVHYLSRLYVKRDEAGAVRDQTEGVSVGQEMRELAEEYEERETLAAKVLKDADMLDIEIELMESIARGEFMGEIIHKKRAALREKLHTKTAKRFFDVIRVSNPHDWHTEGKNRFTAGDWKDV
ncbi:HD domain-containing protein [Candidatus Saccharibacteria bacterium]|nr:HD domain-containing protein [Candidatus Saccharibacteria bacterium]